MQHCAGWRRSSAPTSSRRRARISSQTIRRVVVERGTTYVLLGTPDESRRREIIRGSLVSALVRSLPGVDVRVIANRADRKELAE